jgi:hypothetical protein
MTTKPDILADRERIKAIITRKIEAIIEWRWKWSSRRIKKRDLIAIFKKLETDLHFLIDHPNYKRRS